eukprot:gene6518-7018_t
MAFYVTLAKWLCPNYFKVAEDTNKYQVITIQFSHFCELACWSLRLAKIPFREHGFAPGQHVLPALSVRVGRDKKYLSNSSRTTSVKEEVSKSSCGQLSEEDLKKAKRRDLSARATAVPFAVTPSGDVLLDSWSIAQHAFPNDTIDPELKDLLDNEIGPLARRAVYTHILKESNRNLFNELCMNGRGWFIRLLWTLFLGNMMVKTMMKMFNIKDTPTVQKCHDDLVRAVERLDHYIDERKGKFINGDTIGLSDIAIASLFSPLIQHPNYCEGRYTKTFNELLKRDADIRRDSDYFRQTKSGQYVYEIYDHYRLV